MFRFKRLTGHLLRAHKLEHQVAEVRPGTKILNHMLALGRPESYAVALA